MKKRIIAFLLAALMLLAALAGCAGGADKADEVEENEDNGLLEEGYYVVLDEDGEFIYYLKVTGTKLTYFDENGEETEKVGYKYNAKKDTYKTDDDDVFTVEKSKKQLWLVTDDEKLMLNPIEKYELGTYYSSEPSDEPAPAEPGDEPKPEPEPE
ncbi:MAG: hypothetical protein IJS72_03370, partial [Oscillospiraceae bacterium]|nr:hypothetical protein [Oscillospiraceae bacterium]